MDESEYENGVLKSKVEWCPKTDWTYWQEGDFEIDLPVTRGWINGWYQETILNVLRSTSM